MMYGLLKNKIFTAKGTKGTKNKKREYEGETPSGLPARCRRYDSRCVWFAEEGEKESLTGLQDRLDLNAERGRVK